MPSAATATKGAEEGASYGSAIAPSLLLIPAPFGEILAAAAPLVGSIVGAIAALLGEKAGLPVGSFDELERVVANIDAAVPALQSAQQAAALRAFAWDVNAQLADLQGRQGLSDWDRQHCADLGAVCVRAMLAIDSGWPAQDVKAATRSLLGVAARAVDHGAVPKRASGRGAILGVGLLFALARALL